jgi:hypothetical protein
MMAAGEEKNEYVIAISQNIIKHTNTHTQISAKYMGLTELMSY